MNKAKSLSKNQFQALLKNMGINLTSKELEYLKPIYEQFLDEISPLYAEPH